MSAAAVSDVFVRIRGNIDASFAAMARTSDKILGDLRRKTATLGKSSEQIKSLGEMKVKLDESSKKMAEARAKAVELAEKYATLGVLTKKQAAEVERANAAAERAKAVFDRESKSVRDLSEELRKAGIDTDRLDEESRQLGATLERNERRIQRLDNLGKATELNRQAVNRAHGDLVRTTAAAVGFAAGIAAITAKGAAFDHQLTAMRTTTGQTTEAIARADAQIWKVSRTAMQAGSGLQEGLAVLVGKNLDFDSSIASIKDIGVTATATSSDVRELSETAFTLQNALGIKPTGLAEAFGILSESGKKGGFELKEMAKWMPVLGGGLKALKMQGPDAVATLGAALQVAREFTGSGDEAANNMNNFLSKLMSPEVLGKAKKAGLNIHKVVQKAIKEGKNPFEEVMAGLDRVTKGGDVKKLGSIFGDMQVNHFVRDMLAGLQKYKEIKAGALSNADGSIAQDFEIMSKTTTNQIGAVTHRLEELVVKLSRGLAPAVQAVLGDWMPMIDRFADFVAANPATVESVVKLTAAVLGLRIGLLALKLVGLTGTGGVLTIAKSIAQSQAAAIAVGPSLVAKTGKSIGAGFGSGAGYLAQGFAFWGSVAKQGIGKAFSPLTSLGSKVGGWLGPPIAATAGWLSKPFAVLGNLVGKGSGWLARVAAPILQLGSGALPFLSSAIAKIGLAFAAIPGPGWVIAIAAVVIAAAIAVYRKWDWLKAWFSGIWEGIKSALNPLRTAFSRLGSALEPMAAVILPALQRGWDFVSEALGRAWNWIKSFFGPVEETVEGLNAAKESGRSFGETLAGAIEWCFKPLELLINAMSWVIENTGKVVDFAKDAWDVVSFGDDEPKPQASTARGASRSGPHYGNVSSPPVMTKTTTNHNNVTIIAKGSSLGDIDDALQRARLTPSNSGSRQDRGSFVDD